MINCMLSFFLLIYNFFKDRKLSLYIILAMLTVVLSFFAFRVRYEEDISAFVPKGSGSENINNVFRNLKIKDNIVVVFSGRESQIDSLIAAGDIFMKRLESSPLYKSHIDRVIAKVDMDKMMEMTDFVYDNLPIFIDSSQYSSLQAAISADSVDARMSKALNSMMSPTSVFTKEFVFKDPLGLGNEALSKLQSFRLDGNYNVYNEHIFSSDKRNLLITIAPHFPAGNIKENALLVKELETIAGDVDGECADVDVACFGGPVVATYNSQQIRTDSLMTLTFAFLLIAVVIFLSFRNKFSILLIFAPVVFGVLFSLSVIYFVRGSISLIAVGAGSAVLGVVLSYSIHVVAHREHTRRAEDLIMEMTKPLTIGSLTTIGAFFSLLFTSSVVLQDFGLFASLTIVGTTFFCLVFLPHFLSFDEQYSSPKKLLTFIEKVNSYHYEKNKVLVAVLILASLIGFWYSNDISFNSDMNSLCYKPKELERTENKLDSIFQGDAKIIYFISVGSDTCSVYDAYRTMNKRLDSLQMAGRVVDFACATPFLFSAEEQKEKIRKWNEFWNEKRVADLKTNVRKYGSKYGFSEDAFLPFFEMVEKKYDTIDYSKVNFFTEWYAQEEGSDMAISKVKLKEDLKPDVYDSFSRDKSVVVLDKPFFASSFVQSLKDDFYFVLFVSSILVFLALLASYGRIELALLSFVPMALSWFIILGLMALLGIEFNIVNIIISTFIFGIGDDFSIFVTDGLISEYRNGRKMLSAHKVAIFFSAFTTIVGMGALVFAKHPALRSVAFSSIIGMFAVVLIAYAIQPLIWDFFVLRRTRRGAFPWTLCTILETSLSIGLFFFFLLALFVYNSLLMLVPISKRRRLKHIHSLVSSFCGIVIKSAFFTKKVRHGELNLDKPSVIIANHQSILDIPMLLSLDPRLIMVTKDWVWKSSVIGSFIRSLGFVNVNDGIENCNAILSEDFKEGYSVVIFPEGQRCVDGELGRFHVGAFAIAEEFGLDVIPIVITGNSDAIKKGDLMISRTVTTLDILPAIKHDDLSWGTTRQKRRQSISSLFKAEYAKAMAKYNNVQNIYYNYKLNRNFILKGPVTEWYMRIKVGLEHNYELFDKLISRQARIVDIGCGYGFLSYMLSFVSKERKILGIDYDEEKIAVANNCFSKNENIKFVACDAISYDLPESDVFIMNDMLHYMPYERQEALIKKCYENLLEGGLVIIRDGDSENEDKHSVTKITELFSTKILSFNKTAGNLYFTSRKRIEEIATKLGCMVESVENDHYTSNTIFILRK